MIITLAPEEITDWFVAFSGDCTPWLNRFVPGRFKHARAFGFSRGCQVWVFYDVAYAGTSITLAPAGPQGDAMVGQFVQGSAVLKVPRQRGNANRRAPRLFFWCAPAIRHLLNLPGGALLPDALWRDCIKADAKVVIDEPARPSPSRSDDCCAASASDG